MWRPPTPPSWDVGGAFIVTSITRCVAGLVERYGTFARITFVFSETASFKSKPCRIVCQAHRIAMARQSHVTSPG